MSGHGEPSAGLLRFPVLSLLRLNLAGLQLLIMCGCTQQPSGDSGIGGNEDANRDIPAAVIAARDGAKRGGGETAPESPAAVTAMPFERLSAELVPEVIPANGSERDYSTILESLGSGLAAIDVDRDGWDDLVIAGGGDFGNRSVLSRPISLLRNRSDRFDLIAAATVLPETELYHHGVSAADLNSDGFTDFVLCGYGGAEVYLNAGDGTWYSAGRLASCDGQWCVSAASADFSGDGAADIFIATYVDWSFENDPPCYAEDGVTRDNCSPRLFNGQPDQLLLSDGQGGYRDAADHWGVNSHSKALGVVAADLDLDGDVDLYVGNDVMTNHLYRNEEGRSFEDVTVRSGAGVSSRGTPDASMGVDVCDFNGDGRPDLWSANFEHESFAIYRNQGDWLFRNVSELTGVASIPALYVGWGTAFQDFDRDGDSDVVVANGNVVKHPAHSAVRQRMLLLENQNQTWFEETGGDPRSPFSESREGRGLVVLDWNHDGRADIGISPVNTPVELLENRCSGESNWLSFRLIGTAASRHPVGAVVELQLRKHSMTRQVKGGGSYASTSSELLLFGIPADAEVQRLVVHWPGGTRTEFPVPEFNSILTLIEGRATATAIPD